MKKKICFIINPLSGSSRKEHYSDWINAGIDKGIFEIDIVYTKAPGHATELSREAASKNYYSVVAVGGDGSVNEVARGLMGYETALGIIPTGSGNGMARHLKIPADFKRALCLLNNSVIERIDTLSVNEHFGIGTFGIGFDAHIAHLFASADKRGYSTYVKLVLKEFRSYPAYQYNLVIDGKNILVRSFLLTFANSSQFGNNAVIAPFADVKDGKIDISIVKKFPALASVNLIYKMMNNSLHKSRFFETFCGEQIVVNNSNEIKGHIDGEPLLFKGDIRVKINPLSLNVLIENRSTI